MEKLTSFELVVLEGLVKEEIKREVEERLEHDDLRHYEFDSLDDLARLFRKLDAMFETEKENELSCMVKRAVRKTAKEMRKETKGAKKK